MQQLWVWASNILHSSLFAGALQTIDKTYLFVNNICIYFKYFPITMINFLSVIDNIVALSRYSWNTFGKSSVEKYWYYAWLHCKRL